jgi:uncharacterized protein
LYYLADLMNLSVSLYKAAGWDACRNDLDKIVHIMGHVCGMDAHWVREEQIIMPQLIAHLCEDLPKLIFGEHKRLHKQRVELKRVVDSIDKMEFGEWLERFSESIHCFVPAVREHTYKEEHILYPEAVKVIKDPQVWDNMKAACDAIGLCCF